MSELCARKEGLASASFQAVLNAPLDGSGFSLAGREDKLNVIFIRLLIFQ